ncbi:MAG: MOSC domain-containing protein [Pseudohongiellaceae bacterium]|nr:MOSC domain-containing protein [Pseudohongiellaceae bacterium]
MSRVLAIYFAEQANATMSPLQTAALEAGKGIVGDRYYSAKGSFSEKLAGLPDIELTLIESEEVERFNKAFGFSFSCADFRRNIVTQGAKLNDLVGKEFFVDKVKLKGIRLCEPCANLAKVLVPDVMIGLRGKAGLRAAILNSASLSVGDEIGENAL